MMRIAIVLRDITESGGGEAVCINLANAFGRDLGYDVSIISLFYANDGPTYSLDKNISINALSYKKSFMQSKGIKKLLHKTYTRSIMILKAHKAIQDLQPDIVISNDGTFIPIKKLPKARYIRIWHLDIPKRSKRNFKNFDSIVILTSANLALWQRIHSSIFVIPNFLPYIPDRLTNWDNKIILAVGRLSEEKNFARLLDIYNLICRDFPHWRLIIIGDGKLKDSLNKRIAELQLQDYVQLAGFIKDMESAYLSASICVSTSIFEGFGMALAEGSSYALAPISFNINGPSDIIADKDLLINDDNNAFANTLRSLMENRDMRESKGRRARDHVISHFSKANVLKLWEACLCNKSLES